jgi:hypothetical protein
MKERGLVGVVALALAVGLLGCLEYEEQTVYFEHDRENDRLVIILDYLGLFAEPHLTLFAGGQEGEPGPKELEEAQQQLAEALEDHTVALFGNWPFALSVEETRRDLAEPPGGDEDLPPDLRAGLTELLGRVEVLNGGFHMDAAGRLSGAQVIVVEQARDSVALANRTISRGILHAAEDEGLPANPEERRTVEAILAAALEGHEWIGLDGQALIVRVPATEEIVRAGRPELFEDAPETEEDARSLLRDVVALLRSPIWAWHEDGMLSFKLGYAGRPWRVTALPRQGTYLPNLEEHIAATYGLDLDANLARYLLDAEAPAETEAEKAARIMGPRLSQRQRLRVLLGRLEAAPSERLRELLRQEGRPPGVLLASERDVTGRRPLAELTDTELQELWALWLRREAGAPADGQRALGEH